MVISVHVILRNISVHSLLCVKCKYIKKKMASSCLWISLMMQDKKTKEEKKYHESEMSGTAK